MRLLKRIVAVILMVLSGVLIVVFVGALAGNWIVNNTVTDGIIRVSAGIDTALQRTEDALAGLDTAVGDARGKVQRLGATLDTAGKTLEKDPAVLASVSESLELDIAPAVEAVAGPVQSIHETVLAAQNTVQALNTLPFISIGGSVADESKLQALSGSVTGLAEDIQAIRSGVRGAAPGTAAAAASALSQRAASLDARLAEIETTLAGIDTRVSALRAEVSGFMLALPSWLDWASAAFSLLMIWLLVSQVVTFIFGLSVFKGRNLFGSWMGGTPQPGSS